MTRRDIIVVAVLANMGILAVLFMLAFRLEDQKVRDSSEIAFVISPTAANDAEGIEIDVSKAEDEGDDSDALIEEALPIAAVQEQDQEEEIFQFGESEPEKVAVVTQTPPQTQPAPSGNMVDVTVRKGDVLEKIAKANGTTVDAILKANNLKTDKLKIGQVLHVPVNTRKPAQSTKPAQPNKPLASADNSPAVKADPEYYTVKSGDNPWKIAKQFNLKVDELLKLNNLNEESARNMKIGDKVRVK